MKRNFRFDPISVIPWEGGAIDLHNAYDIVRFGSDLVGSEAALEFSRNDHAICSDLPSKVAIRCSGNVRFAFNDLNELAAPLNLEGIEIGYFDEGCDDWQSLTDEKLAETQEPMGLHVGFINGFAVRIFCDSATFEVSE